MGVNNQVNGLLQKRMDRKNFLKHVGVGVLAMTGLTSALKMLQGPQRAPQGYGGDAYGGSQRTSTASQSRRAA